MKFEICSNSIESCLAAANAGADRVELCSSLSEGGVTPSYSVVEYCVKELPIATNVLIRPRGGDFVYTDLEIEIMKRDIEIFRSIGVDGIVVGCLTNDGDIDTRAMGLLIESAEGMSVTFHRAFDLCQNSLLALETIISLGCERILTSGQAPTAFDGRTLLKELNQKSAGRITIMPGCGVNIDNIKEIVDYTGVCEIHFSASAFRNSLFNSSVKNVDFGAQPTISDEKKIRNMLKCFE